MKIYFEVISRLDKHIRTTESHWNLIVRYKHPEVEGMEKEVQETLIFPESVRISQEDDRVFLYYRQFGKLFVCVVCKHFESDGFIITCYLTNKVKEGKQVWPR